MKKEQLTLEGYSSPKAWVVEILPEAVLCQSTIIIPTMNLGTGANWSVGEDAEW